MNSLDSQPATRKVDAIGACQRDQSVATSAIDLTRIQRGVRAGASILIVVAFLTVLAWIVGSLSPAHAAGASVPALSSSGTSTPSPTTSPTATPSPTPTPNPQPQLPRKVVLGHSYLGRSLIAIRQGSATATRVLLVIGQMHGNERAGVPIVAKLRTSARIPRDVAIWTIATINPDGYARHTRQNRRHVDLNRNFAYGWRHHATGGSQFYPGRRAASELETRETVRFLRMLRPDAVVIFHQAGNGVDTSGSKGLVMSRELARGIGLPLKRFRCHGVCRGTLTSWFNHYFAGTAITVELPSHVSTRMRWRAVVTLVSASRSLPDF